MLALLALIVFACSIALGVRHPTTFVNEMPQDQNTGAAGNEFGRENAKKLAETLGAKLTKPGSNEARWDGKLVALKSAAVNTKSVGVTYLMLDRIDEVIAALQRDDGAFDLYSLSASAFRSAMTRIAVRVHASRGPYGANPASR